MENLNFIQQEYEASRDKMFKDFAYGDETLVELTRDNVAIAEAMIRNDSAYRKSMCADAAPDNKYGGSSAYWMSQLKRFLEDSNDSQLLDQSIIKGAVESVDRENSTHLNADECGREEIIKRLCKLTCAKMTDYLREPEKENFKLISILSEATTKNRKNKSFASKFCHYACFYVFEDTKWQDNYSIWDSIIRKVLPSYYEYYTGKKDLIREKLNDYSYYRSVIDAVIGKAEEKISRNGFDHLLWYYHKGRL